jgi:hypothetical protein
VAWWIVAIVVGVILISILFLIANEARHRKRLQQHLGGRTREGQEDTADTRTHPLDANTKERYVRDWRRIQDRFVESPVQAIMAADELAGELMRERGYPTARHDQQMANVSVEDSRVLNEYRTAHDMSEQAGHDEGSTEGLRQAMMNYRVLFDDLLAHR